MYDTLFLCSLTISLESLQRRDFHPTELALASDAVARLVHWAASRNDVKSYDWILEKNQWKYLKRDTNLLCGYVEGGWLDVLSQPPFLPLLKGSIHLFPRNFWSTLLMRNDPQFIKEVIALRDREGSFSHHDLQRCHGLSEATLMTVFELLPRLFREKDALAHVARMNCVPLLLKLDPLSYSVQERADATDAAAFNGAWAAYDYLNSTCFDGLFKLRTSLTPDLFLLPPGRSVVHTRLSSLYDRAMTGRVSFKGDLKVSAYFQSLYWLMDLPLLRQFSEFLPLTKDLAEFIVLQNSSPSKRLLIDFLIMEFERVRYLAKLSMRFRRPTAFVASVLMCEDTTWTQKCKVFKLLLNESPVNERYIYQSRALKQNPNEDPLFRLVSWLIFKRYSRDIHILFTRAQFDHRKFMALQFVLDRRPPISAELCGLILAEVRDLRYFEGIIKRFTPSELEAAQPFVNKRFNGTPPTFPHLGLLYEHGMKVEFAIIKRIITLSKTTFFWSVWNGCHSFVKSYPSCLTVELIEYLAMKPGSFQHSLLYRLVLEHNLPTPPLFSRAYIIDPATSPAEVAAYLNAHPLFPPTANHPPPLFPPLPKWYWRSKLLNRRRLYSKRREFEKLGFSLAQLGI